MGVAGSFGCCSTRFSSSTGLGRTPLHSLLVAMRELASPLLRMDRGLVLLAGQPTPSAAALARVESPVKMKTFQGLARLAPIFNALLTSPASASHMPGRGRRLSAALCSSRPSLLATRAAPRSSGTPQRSSCGLTSWPPSRPGSPLRGAVTRLCLAPECALSLRVPRQLYLVQLPRVP